MMLWRCFVADGMKLRGSLALWITVLLPALAAFALTLGLVHAGFGRMPMARANPAAFYMVYVLQTWLITAWPLFVALLTALLHGLDHANGNYRYLFGLPVPRASVVASKLLWAMLLCGVALVVLALSLVLGLQWLAWARPEMGLAPGAWPQGLGFFPLVWLASLSMIALQDWVALRFAGMVPAMAVGLAMTVLTTMAAHAESGQLSPWVLPMKIGNAMLLHTSPWSAVIQSLCTLPLVAGLMVFDTRRREFA